jgi:hypothetical protein
VVQTKIDPKTLIGYAEAADIIGVKTETMHFYHGRSRRRGYPEGLVPEPVLSVGGHPMWTRKQIEEWHANRPGPGNHTKGATREGYKGGRKPASG